MQQQKQAPKFAADNLRRAVSDVVRAGYQLDRQAFEALKATSARQELTKIVEGILAEARRSLGAQAIIPSALVEKITSAFLVEVEPAKPVVESVGRQEPYSKQIEAQLNVVRDPGSEAGSGATIEDFGQYFRHRFEKQREIFYQRLDSRDATSLGVALAAGLNEKVKFVAMVMEKRERGRRLFFEVDDVEDTATVLVDGQDNRELLEAAQNIPLDQVACFEAVRSRRDLFVAQNVLLPDIPDRRPKGAGEEVYTVLLSDLHVGSRMFLPEVLQRVLDWLNLKLGNPQQRRIAERAKYVVIGGDVVDGIGVYPRQEDELAVPDIYKQYELAAEYVAQIPEHMELIVIPGNHDAVRQAMPQPPIMKTVAEPLYSARGMLSLGNPAEVQLHGVNFLLHHGRSLDDIIATIPGMSFRNPVKGMEFQLKCRHLVPEYGKRTAVAPERVDHLVIERPPDVFQSGHIHVAQHSVYRGTRVVNSGAWQAQTDYQRRLGLMPTPGILPIVNLQTLDVSMINFLTPLE